MTYVTCRRISLKLAQMSTCTQGWTIWSLVFKGQVYCDLTKVCFAITQELRTVFHSWSDNELATLLTQKSLWPQNDLDQYVFGAFRKYTSWAIIQHHNSGRGDCHNISLVVGQIAPASLNQWRAPLFLLIVFESALAEANNLARLFVIRYHERPLPLLSLVWDRLLDLRVLLLTVLFLCQRSGGFTWSAVTQSLI